MKQIFTVSKPNIMKKSKYQRNSNNNNNNNNNNNQIFHAFLFNIRNYSPKVTDIQFSCEAELNIVLPRVNNFDIKQKRHGIFVLLYASNTKQVLRR